MKFHWCRGLHAIGRFGVKKRFNMLRFHRSTLFLTRFFLGAHAEIAAHRKVFDGAQQRDCFIGPAHRLFRHGFTLQFSRIVCLDNFPHGLLRMIRHELRGRFIHNFLGDNGVPMFLRIAHDGHARHVADKGGHPLHSGFCFMSPGGGDSGHDIYLRLVLAHAEQNGAVHVFQQMFAIAANIERIVGMNAQFTDDQQRRFGFPDILFDGIMGLAVQQLGFYLDAKISGDRAGDSQVAVIYFGQSRIDDFFVQFFLLLEFEYLACRFGQHPGNAVKRNIMIIGVEGGNHLDGHLPVSGQSQGGEQSPVGLGRAVHRDDNRAFFNRAARFLDNQRIDSRTSRHPPAHGAQTASFDGAETQCAHDEQIINARICFLRERPVIFSFQRAALEIDAKQVAFVGRLIEIGIGNDRQATGNQVIVHIPLALQLLFLPELFGQAAFHLAEAHVMQLGGINMGTGDHGVFNQFRQFRCTPHGGIGMIGGIQRNQDTLI